MGDQSNRKAVFIESSWKVSTQSLFLEEEMKDELEQYCLGTTSKTALNSQEKKNNNSPQR